MPSFFCRSLGNSKHKARSHQRREDDSFRTSSDSATRVPDSFTSPNDAMILVESSSSGKSLGNRANQLYPKEKQQWLSGPWIDSTRPSSRRLSLPARLRVIGGVFRFNNISGAPSFLVLCFICVPSFFAFLHQQATPGIKPCSHIYTTGGCWRFKKWSSDFV